MPDTKESQALAYFQSQGWTAAQSAGIVANLKHESGLSNTVVGDGGLAYGVAQWHPDRQARFLMTYGKDIKSSSYEEQLAFVHKELKTSGWESTAGAKLAAATSPEDAARVVAQYYERPLSTDYSARIATAKFLFGSAATSVSDKIKELIGSGKPVDWGTIGELINTVAGGPAAVAGDALNTASKSFFDIDLKAWFEEKFKDVAIPAGVAFVGFGLCAFAAWQLVKNTEAVNVIQSGVKKAVLKKA